MSRQRRRARMLGVLMASTILVGVSGASCLDFIGFSGLDLGFSTVDIELVNMTDYPVDPGLYVDPDELFFATSVFTEENYVPVEPPLASGEIVTLTFDCDDIGTAGTDYAWLLVSSLESVESDNAPTVREEDDFECGDVISFIFIDEVGGDFFTRVEVNGRFVED